MGLEKNHFNCVLNEEGEVSREMNARNIFYVEVRVEIKMLMYETAWSVLGTLPRRKLYTGGRGK